MSTSQSWFFVPSMFRFVYNIGKVKSTDLYFNTTNRRWLLLESFLLFPEWKNNKIVTDLHYHLNKRPALSNGCYREASLWWDRRHICNRSMPIQWRTRTCRKRLDKNFLLLTTHWEKMKMKYCQMFRESRLDIVKVDILKPWKLSMRLPTQENKGRLGLWS